MYKNGFQKNLIGICYCNNYSEFIELLETCISKKLMQLDSKEISGYYYKGMNKRNLIKKKVLDKLIDYKVRTSNNQQQYSRFLTDKILSHIKVRDEEMQQECLKHLLNLMSKK